MLEGHRLPAGQHGARRRSSTAIVAGLAGRRQLAAPDRRSADDSAPSRSSPTPTAPAPRSHPAAPKLRRRGIQVSVPDNTTTTFYAMATLAGFTSNLLDLFDHLPGGQPKAPEAANEGPRRRRRRAAAGGTAACPTLPEARRRRSCARSPQGRRQRQHADRHRQGAGRRAVQVFDGAGCRRRPVLAAGSAAQFAAGFPVQVADNTIDLPLRRLDRRRRRPLALHSGPGRLRRGLDRAAHADHQWARRPRPASARPSSASPTPPATRRRFLCRLDRGTWKPCQLAAAAERLGRRRHTLAVRATDAAGNAETKGAKRRFKVIRTAALGRACTAAALG